jgi:hypothetical protein
MSRPLSLAIALILVLLGFGLGRLWPSKPPGPLYGPQAGKEAKQVDDVPEDEAEREIRAALDEPDGFVRLIALAQLLQRSGPSAVPAVARMVQRADDSVRPQAAELELLVRFWAQYEPERATRWAMVSPLAYRTVVIAPAMEAWAVADPAAAAHAALTGGSEKGAATQVAQVSVVRGWFASGNPGLVEYIESLPSGLNQLRAMSVFSRELVAQRGAEFAADWAVSLPDEPVAFKRDFIRQMSTAIAADDLEVATAFCEQVCDEPYGEGVRKRIAQQWAMADGPAALNWLSDAPPGPETDLAVRVAFDSWRKADQGEAFSWLSGIGSDGVERWLQPAVPIYAKILSATDPEAAMAWVELIPNDDELQITAVRVARRWRLVDEAAVEAWLEQSSLPEPMRQAARTTNVEAPIPQPQLID